MMCYEQLRPELFPWRNILWDWSSVYPQQWDRRTHLEAQELKPAANPPPKLAWEAQPEGEDLGEITDSRGVSLSCCDAFCEKTLEHLYTQPWVWW